MDVAYTSGNASATRYMREKFLRTGVFEALTDKKYLTGSEWLRRGDVLVNEGHHTVMVLADGAETVKEDEMDYEKFKEMYKRMRLELQDNDSGSWSVEALDWAKKSGLFEGNGQPINGEPNYMWEDVVTREQLVTVLYRFYIMLALQIYK